LTELSHVSQNWERCIQNGKKIAIARCNFQAENAQKCVCANCALDFALDSAERATLSPGLSGGSVVRVLDTRPKGPRFNAQSLRYQLTALGKLSCVGASV